MRTTSSHSPTTPTHTGENGFTLIELMITVACVAILAAIAYPNYSEYMLRARRTDAKNALLEVAGRQERFHSIHNRYAKTAAELGYGTLPLAVPSAGASPYELSVDFDEDGKTYTAKATPQGSQTKDQKCHTYTLSHTGAQGNRDSSDEPINNPSCW